MFKNLKTALEKGNAAIDEKLIQAGLKRRVLSPFELKLPSYIQSFVLNVNSGLTVDQALVLAAENLDMPEAYRHELAIRANPTLGLIYYTQHLNSETVSRVARLISQSKKTGSVHLMATLEKAAEDMLNERFEAFKQKSEKISVQLTFLLSLSLISVIIIAVSPVMLTL